MNQQIFHKKDLVNIWDELLQKNPPLGDINKFLSLSMKTETFGLSNTFIYTARLSFSMPCCLAPPAPPAKPFRSPFQYALSKYKEGRYNFKPQSDDLCIDGFWSLVSPHKSWSALRYDQGIGDAAWCAEQDRIFLASLPPGNRVPLKTATFGISWNVRAWVPGWKAIINYLARRSNGNNSDNPPRLIPLDGTWFWESPGAARSRVVYVEGPQDHIWMEERDRNYLARLARGDIRNAEEQLDAQEQRNHPYFCPAQPTFAQRANLVDFSGRRRSLPKAMDRLSLSAPAAAPSPLTTASLLARSTTVNAQGIFGGKEQEEIRPVSTSSAPAPQ